MDGREPLYLRPGMSEVELFREFNGRNPYYRHIASELVRLVRKIKPEFGHVVDILARTGYTARAVGNVAKLTLVEHRRHFVEFLENEVAASRNVTLVEEEPLHAFGKIDGIDEALCCEQAHQLQPNLETIASDIAVRGRAGRVFAMTFGPSHHRFTTMKIADHRSGVVNPGETMSELSHPIKQAVHKEIVRLAKERHGYTQDEAWPPFAKAFDAAEIRGGIKKAGFRDLAVVEDAFAVPGHQIHLYEQNGWTFYFRWPPLSDLQKSNPDAVISLLKEAIENVRARPEYDDWCKITAYHPVAYLIAF